MCVGKCIPTLSIPEVSNYRALGWGIGMEKRPSENKKKKKKNKIKPKTSQINQTVRFLSLTTGLEVVFTQEDWLFSLVRRNEEKPSVL